MDVTTTQVLVLRRSWNLWIPMGILLVIGACYWTAKLTGHLSNHPYTPAGARANALGLMAPFVAAIGMVYDFYQRVVRNTRLEFSAQGIADYASSDRLGEIPWEAVDAVAFKRQWLGATFIINFKAGVPINDHVESWDKLIIDSLQVTEQDAARINALLETRKIAGGLDRS